MVRAIAYGGGTYFANYYWGYHTFDGSWANKHGKTAPELIDEGYTPFSTDTSGWNLGNTKNFYNSTVHIFIVTIP